jgi:DNA polymerase-1
MLLSSAYLDRSLCYITNVLKCRPPNNDIDSNEAREAINICVTYLYEELDNLHYRNIIVALGGTALAALGVTHKITQVRGTIVDSPRWGKIIPTYHPAYLMRQWHEYITSVYDWKKIKRYSDGCEPPVIEERFNLYPTITQIEMFVLQILQRAQSTHVTIGLDIETFEEHPMLSPIKIVGIAIDSETAITVPFITQSGNLAWSTKDEQLRAIMALGSLLEHPNITKMIQNSLFDLLVLASLGFEISGPVYDTMLAHMLIYYPAQHSLAYLLSIYADYPAWKTINDNSDAGYRKYNSRDATVLFMIKDKLDKDMFDNNVLHLFKTDMSIIIPTIEMTLNGILIDTTKQKEVERKLKSDVDNSIVILRKLANHPGYNPNSTSQTAYILFDMMKLRSDVKTKGGGGRSTAEDVLNRLSLRYPDSKFIDTLIEHRSLQKMYSTFSNPPIINGRVHAIYKLRPVTGRYSTENPNIHALPTKTADSQGYIKEMYIASPGHVIFKVDYSQAEIVCFAVIAGDERWIVAIANGWDIHRLNMIDVIGIYNPLFRRFFKEFFFGLMYGSKGFAIKKKAPKELIEIIDIDSVIPKFISVHPALPNYWDRIEKSIKETRKVIGEFGRIRYFAGNITEAELREGINFPIQNCVSEIMKLKLATLERELDLSTIKLVMQKHDEFIFDIPENLLDSSAGVIIKIMNEKVTSITGKTFPLKVSSEYGKDLLNTIAYEMKE